MSIKKKLGLGVASAALGLSLVAGGTFAYFSDTEITENTFAAGTLDLSVDPSTIINVNNLKPGDWMNRTFKLKNDGTLDISKVILTTDYDNEELAKHIRVNFLRNLDKSGVVTPNDIVYSTTLDQLKGTAPDAVQKKIWSPFGENSGLKAGTKDDFKVQFEFVDNGKDQNHLQNASLKLTWTFEAKQTAGESR
ncbi:cell division protein FtsN [Pueribacillus theae]|uniref:Cell division protein FtsN n=1 Tax=Pueribacillus theae TaxID=2171751 RepID=A0A2U1JSX9_9BACI|nr:TasA family protein [Pueribacillus theae]PWA08271.1 cell division protein FtsN [Pueribacillus theae]